MRPSTLGFKEAPSIDEVLRSSTCVERDGKGYCYKHRTACRLFPEKREGHVWVDVSGIICTPWSTQGLRLGWLDSKSIPTLVHYMTLIRSEVDIVLLECTPLLDLEHTNAILSNAFVIEPVVFDSKLLGLPCSRRRLWIRLPQA